MTKFYKLERTNRKTGKHWTAYCEERDGRVIVKAGSFVSDQELTHLNSEIRHKRDTTPIDSNRRLLVDVEVKNLAHAAMFILATNASPSYWEPYTPIK